MRIGIFGTGQLGQMLALSGIPLGYEFFFYDLTARKIYDSLNRSRTGVNYSLEQFIDLCDIFTYESENTDVDLLANINKPVYPPITALQSSQERFTEKSFLQKLNIPTARFDLITNNNDITTKISNNNLSFPAHLKTLRMGYDGKGQAIVPNRDCLKKSWDQLNNQPCLLEEHINFKRELSIIGCRDQYNNIIYYPLAENYHQNRILRYSIISKQIFTDTKDLQHTAQEYLKSILLETNYIGILALELFETNTGELLANEMAPRVHNTGHWSIDGSTCSQFENHIRAITGKIVKQPRMLAECVGMMNLIGELPDHSLLFNNDYKIHLYGKTARPNRKLGHITALGPNRQTIEQKLSQLTRIFHHN